MADIILRSVPSDSDRDDVRLYAPPAQIVGAGGIASAEAFGTPAVAANIAATGIASAEAFGQPTVAVGSPASIVDAGGIPSGEAFGLPLVGDAPAVTSGQTPAGGKPLRYKKRRKFVIDGQEYEGTAKEARAIIATLLKPKPETPQEETPEFEPLAVDLPRYLWMVMEARQQEDPWLLQLIQEAWERALEEDDAEALILLL